MHRIRIQYVACWYHSSENAIFYMCSQFHGSEMVWLDCNHISRHKEWSIRHTRYNIYHSILWWQVLLLGSLYKCNNTSKFQYFKYVKCDRIYHESKVLHFQKSISGTCFCLLYVHPHYPKPAETFWKMKLSISIMFYFLFIYSGWV